jgi:uncharacterized membrane protein YgdD (TMEM256/DUF423 family)
MRNRSRAALLLLAIILISVSTIRVAHGELYEKKRELTDEEWERLKKGLPTALDFKMVTATLTTILLFGIIMTHIRVYRETGTQFSLGLVIFSFALILYTLASNPILHKLIGYKKIGLAPLLMLPDLFMVVAAAIFLYLSRQ